MNMIILKGFVFNLKNKFCFNNKLNRILNKKLTRIILEDVNFKDIFLKDEKGEGSV